MKNIKTDLSIKQALHLFHQDGALDIIAGATLLNFGFDVLSNAESTSLLTWIPIILLTSIKNKNTLPKISTNLENITEKQLRNWTIIPSIALVLILVLLGILMLSDPLNLANVAFLSQRFNLSALLAFLLIAIACLVPALWIGLQRFFIYAGVAVVGGLVSFFILPAFWMMFATAAVMLFFGGRAMARFSREYVLPEEKTTDEE